jgi:thymidylate synthase (FAD)
MKVKLINYTPEPEKTIAMAAKLCYSPVGTDDIEEKLTEEGIKKFIKMITDIGHGSVLEHVSFTFSIEGISRACSHQLVRHRIASYSQQSQRYVNLSNTLDFITPPQIAKRGYANKVYEKYMNTITEVYKDLVESLIHKEIKENYKNKMKAVISDLLEDKRDHEIETILKHWDVPHCSCTARKYVEHFKQRYRKEYTEIEKKAIEDVRYILPNACETKIVVTMNARSLFNFFEHRCCERAQWEIRDLATEMLREVKKVAPILFGQAGASCVNGKCPEGNMSCGKMEEVKAKFECL